MHGFQSLKLMGWCVQMILIKSFWMKCRFFEERGKPEYLAKNLSEQRTEPTNSTHMWRRVWESNPGHIGGRRVLSTLCHHCLSQTLPLLCTYFQKVPSTNSGHILLSNLHIVKCLSQKYCIVLCNKFFFDLCGEILCQVMHLHHFLCVLFEELSKLKDTLLCLFKVVFYNPCGPFEFSATRSFGCFPKPLSPKRLALDVPDHAISIILKWCMSITSVVLVISLPSLNISATKSICGTSLLRLPLLLHGSDNVTDGPNSCPLYCHFSLFAFRLDHCLLHKLWWTTPVNSMNCTWTTFRYGSCFIDEHQGPCSPASTSQHIVSGIL